MKVSACNFYGVNTPIFNNERKVNFKGDFRVDDFQSSQSQAAYCINRLQNALSIENFNSDDVSKTIDKIKKLPPKEKKEFIERYCKETGFPDMQKTSDLIVENVTNSLIKAQEKSGAKVLLAGYNPTCSVAIGHALPGSDFDTFFVCMENWNNCDKFYNEFTKNINPLLCSMICQRTNDLPDFVVIDDIKNSVDNAQSVFNEQELDRNSDIYNSILNKQISDWTKAGTYNRDLNKFIADKDKTPLLRAGLLMEIYRDGEIIVDNLDKETKEKLKNSCVYKYSNMQQMRSYKNAPLKNKHKNREKILADFDKLSDDKKLDLIFNVIKLSVKDLKNEVSSKYNPMFKDAGCGNMEDLIQPLLSNEHRQEYYKD